MARRILFLVPSDLKSLRAKGVEDLIFERDEFGHFEKVITIHPLATKEISVALSPRHHVFEYSLRTLLYPTGFRWILFPLLPLYFLSILYRLKKTIETESIDLIRATDPYLMGGMALILSRLTRRPFCISLHTDYDWTFKLSPASWWRRLLRKMGAFIAPWISRRADLVLPIRQSYVPLFKKWGLPDQNVWVIPHGLNLDTEEDPPLSLSDFLERDLHGRKILSYVGRLEPDNYIHDVLKIAASLATKRQDCCILIAGAGSAESLVNAFQKQYPEHLVYLGSLPRKEARALRSASTINLCFSGGFSLLEAMASGRPVITYDVDWHREVIEAGVDGLIVNESNLEATLLVVERLLNDAEWARKLGHRGREKIFATYDIRKASQIKIRAYESLLSSRTLSS